MALIRKAIEAGDLDAALGLSNEAVGRFPLLPRLRLDLAAVAKARGDGPGEIEALRQALAISPGWGTAARQLSMAHERAGDLASSRAVLEQATAILHAYRRAVRRIGSDVGGMVAKTWSTFRWAQPRVTKLP